MTVWRSPVAEDRPARAASTRRGRSDQHRGCRRLTASGRARRARCGARLELFSTLRTIARGGQSVLLVEQNVHPSLRLADRVHVLENGRVVRSETPPELREDKAIQQAYLGL